MKDGSVHEYEAPVQGKYDTTKSYLIELSINCRKYKFKSIKSRLRVKSSFNYFKYFIKIFKIKISFMKHEEELERIRIEEEERKKKEAEERKRRGIDDEEEKKKKKKKDDDASEEKTQEELDEEEEEKNKKKDEWKPFIPDVPNKICWASYSTPDTFWLSMDDYDAGYLYECKFLTTAEKSKMSPEKIDEPFRSFPVIKSDITHSEDIPLTCMIQK
jgi:hypothetical protein